MAERRMFAKTIIDSDAFLDMPLSTQSLYFHLSMRADDDGFINNPKKVQRMVGCADDDLKLLIAKNFIIPFESGVVVIKHWKIHNYIRNDRYKPTVYQEEKAMLSEKENNAYTLGIPDGSQDGYRLDTQDRLGKDRLGKDRLETESGEAVKTIIDYLNKRAGTAYKASSRKTKDLVSARMNEGFKVEDFQTVIDNKVDEWGKPPKPGAKDMRPFIRPETLFGTKFEAYLNQRRVVSDGEHERIGEHLI
jgi:uncharacterized phage protein (TIGR02220 family)